VLRANILFFDSNPIGRIVTRFSKDIVVLDFIVPTFIIFISSGVFRTITVCITVGIINPYLFIVIALGLVLMWLVLK
jgi:ATP-binding cassette subfamily C (CFTR/MRP) protein 4